MNIQVYNSLTNRIETFEPIESGRVKMYSCGPTVYDFAHIGNFRSFLFGDLLRRFLELAGYDVEHVMNITDVGHMTDSDAADGAGEDRMNVAIQRMKESKKAGKVPDGVIDNPEDPYQIAQYYIDAFLQDARKLGYKVAFEYPERMPRATEHIADMQRMIQELLDRGHAYIADDGVVYFSVESFDDYGTLSGNTLEQLRSGAGGRVSEQDQASKRHPADFLLWKPDEHHIMKWESPWGTGYPGWHIECSVMARELLGQEMIDIHTGGEDLIFPHHECEIAQSRGASGKSHFARYWIHARFLFVEGEKMSKSKGNFYTLRDILEGRFKDSEGNQWDRAVDPAVIRYELIKAHYRSNLNFTSKGIVDSANAVRKLQEFRSTLEKQTGGEAAEVDLSHPVLNEFAEALADDLNVSGALAVVHPWINSTPADPHEALGVFQKINSVLAVAPIHQDLDVDLVGGAEATGDSVEIALQWCRELDDARAKKEYQRADELRQKIIDAGFEVRTTKEGTTIQKQLV